MRWERVKGRGEERLGPGKRWGHTCSAVNGAKYVYVFGGYGGSHISHTNLLHVFHSESQTWSEPSVKGTRPTPRDSHTCSTVENKLFVFGGTDGLNPLGDLHIFDTSSNTWICPNVRGDGPKAREGHGAAVVGKRLYIFGGCGKSANNSDEVHYNDVYILDTENFVWQRAVTSGSAPAARDSHTCSSWKNKIIVIGGEDKHDYYLSDVHILDTDTLVWKELSTSGQLLPPRAGHSSVAFGKYIFVFGGFSDAQNLYDDLHMLDVESGNWTKIVLAGDGPSARFSMSGECLDPSKDGVLLFVGGCDRNLEALDDVFYLHTELARDNGKDEQRLETFSFGKELKIQSQEQTTPSLENVKSLITFGSAHHSTPISVSHNSQQSHQYFHLNMYRPAIGKRTFQAKVTKNFANGYTIETVIDGKPLRGVLFSTSSSAILSPNGKRDANKDTVYSVFGPSQEAAVRDAEDIMETEADSEADIPDEAAAPESLITSADPSAMAEGTSALHMTHEGQALTGDRT